MSFNEEKSMTDLKNEINNGNGRIHHERITTDLVLNDDNTEDNNNDEDDDDDNDDEMSFKSANTSERIDEMELSMRPSLEESFVAYAYDSMIASPCSFHDDYDIDDDIDNEDDKSSFGSEDFKDHSCEEDKDKEIRKSCLDKGQQENNDDHESIQTDTTHKMKPFIESNQCDDNGPISNHQEQIQTIKTIQKQQQQQKQPQPQQHNENISTIQSFTFNQDKNCIAIATSNGYRIRTLPLSNLCEEYNLQEEQGQRNQAENTNDQNQSHRVVKVHQVAYPPPGTTKRGSKQMGISHIQILHSTSVIAVVKNATPRLLSILHAKTAQCIMEIPFTNAIRRIEMNVLSLVVLTADGMLHVFALKGVSNDSGHKNKGIEFIKSIPILHQSESTRMITANSAVMTGAFFDLSSHLFPYKGTKGSNQSDSKCDALQSDESAWLVTKSNHGVGFISVYKTSTKTVYLTKESQVSQSGRSLLSATNTESANTKIVKKTSLCMELVKTVQAHTHGIVRVAIGGASHDNVEDKLFATTSLKGTVIRIFSLRNCQLLYEFHRGTSSCTIFSMSFNSDATMLAVSSSRGTVHIFSTVEAAKIVKLAEGGCEVAEGGSSNSLLSIKHRWYDGLLSNIKKKSSNDDETKPFLIRSIAKIKCRKPILPNIVAMLPTRRNDRDELIAICFENGKLLVYAIPKHNASRMKPRPKPVLADDIMFDKAT